jgi:hypothetical protein
MNCHSSFQGRVGIGTGEPSERSYGLFYTRIAAENLIQLRQTEDIFDADRKVREFKTSTVLQSLLVKADQDLKNKTVQEFQLPAFHNHPVPPLAHQVRADLFQGYARQCVQLHRGAQNGQVLTILA